MKIIYHNRKRNLKAEELLDARLSAEILLGPSDMPSPDRVGYVLARSELNIASWVHKRMVDAGAVSSLDWGDPRRFPEAFRQDFRIIHQTHPYPRARELVREGMEPEVEARLRQVLLQASRDPAARDALKLFFNTSRFLPLDRESEKALDALRTGVQRVRSEVE